MTRPAWVCLTSSCTGRLTITTTEGAKTEGCWQVLAECAVCGRLHLARKRGIALLWTCGPTG